MEASTRAVLTAALAALMGVASFVVGFDALEHLGELPVVAGAILLALAVAAGWPLLLGLPNVLGSAVVIALGGAGAVVAVTATRGQPFLRELPIVIALAILLAFVNELARQDGRARLVDSVSGTVAGVLVAAASAGWVAAERSPSGTALAAMQEFGLVVGGTLGLAMGVLVAALHALFDRLPALRRRAAALTVVVLPVALSGLLVYVVGRVLVR